MAITLEAGDVAPAFAMSDQDGHAHNLADYRGRTVVLYFYPRDNTPGCTKEACSFRDEHSAILAMGAVVLGVSTDTAASHQKFREKFELPFPLLVDQDAKVATAYGAWGEKTLYGRKSVGVKRSTVIIDPTGKIAHRWKSVSAAGHAAKVAERLAKLRG